MSDHAPPQDPAQAALIEQVRQALASGTPLNIHGHGSKHFYGGVPQGEPLDVSRLRGISSHEPSELVVTVRAGTPLAELEAALAEHGQYLPFEPPRLRGRGTVGGMVAAGLAGPARGVSGSVRDYVLGATLLNGRAEVLSFGGQVMKNVAGYDVSRLLAGSMGVLGVMLEVSLKVLPLPVATATLRFDMSQAKALVQLNEWAGLPLPLSASAWWDGALVLRLAGAQAAVDAALKNLGGELIEPTLAASFWLGMRDQSDDFFVGAERAVQAGAALWRLSLPPTAPPLMLQGEELIEWGGGLRWLATALPGVQVREAALRAGGHATLYRSRDKSLGVFTPLSPALMQVHKNLKAAFDPAGLFNPGRLYPEL